LSLRPLVAELCRLHTDTQHYNQWKALHEELELLDRTVERWNPLPQDVGANTRPAETERKPAFLPSRRLRHSDSRLVFQLDNCVQCASSLTLAKWNYLIS